MYVAQGTMTNNDKPNGRERTLNLSGIETTLDVKVDELLIGVGTFDPEKAEVNENVAEK